MKTAIHIVSYVNDLNYLELNLRSIRKFATGFSGVTVLVPFSEAPSFAYLKNQYDVTVLAYNRTKEQSRWHLAAQCQKCFADQHCLDADFILHTDSDCIFTEPVTPDDYFSNGKPIMLYEAYSRLPDDIPWKMVVSAVLLHSVEYEFMRRHPQVNPVGVYRDLRSHIQDIHNTDFQQFVESRKSSYPWGFTEHNIIGAFAWYHPLWRHKYHWHNVGEDGPLPEKLMQFWSHLPVDVPQEISHGGNYTPRQYLEKLIA